jgi:hypothetical protein
MIFIRSICDKCWEEKNGDRVAYRLIVRTEETCHLCGTTNKSGIFVRVEEGKNEPR